MSKKKNPDHTGYVRQRKNGSWEGQFANGASLEAVNPMRFVLCNEHGRPLDPKYFEDWFNKFVRDAGLEPANIHSTRHTFATKALQKTNDINSVSDILGHALPSTTLNMYECVK